VMSRVIGDRAIPSLLEASGHLALGRPTPPFEDDSAVQTP